MKTTLFTLVLLVFAGMAWGQEKKQEKPRYLKHAIPVTPIDMGKSYDSLGLFGSNTATIRLKPKTIIEKMELVSTNQSVEVKKQVNDTILLKTIMIEKGLAFDVIQQLGSYSIIKFWNINEASAKNLSQKLREQYGISKPKSSQKKVYKALNVADTFDHIEVKGLVALAKKGNDTIDYDLSQTYYVLPTKTMENNSTEFENKSGKWNIGLLAMPIKLRPFATESGQFDFLSGYSVGTTFSWTVHHNWKSNFTHNFLVYAGVSSYKADESKIKEFREDYTITTFSPALGWMVEKHNVQLGLLVGIDFPAGELQKKWVYRNMPWFGIGVGVALFKINNENQSKTGENK